MYNNLGKNLSKDEIQKYFNLLNDELKSLNKHGQLLICGGAALTLVYNARDSTRDIDGIFEPKETFRKIIKKVGTENNLADDWLNDGAKGFISTNMTSSVIQSFSNLTISSIDPEPLLAMKLASSRFYGMDKFDSVFLMEKLKIQNKQQLFNILNTYIPKDRLIPKVEYFTEMCYNEYISKKQDRSKQKDTHKKPKCR